MSGDPHVGVRQSYDTVAADYAAHFEDELAHKPLDRALLSALIEQAEPGRPILDLGCGPGHVAAWLADRGVQVVGVDLSREMVETGRRRYGAVEFRQGDMIAMPAEDGEFAAAVAFYSVIHLDPSELRPAFRELHRVLRPAGLLLVAFHIGRDTVHRDEWWGHEVDIDFHLLEPGRFEEILGAAGFTVESRTERVNYPDEFETRRAYLLARRSP